MMFKRFKYRLYVLRTIVPFADGVKRFFALEFILSIGAIALTFIVPLFYKLFIDEVILNRQFNKMIFVIGGYLITFFMDVIIGYIKNYSNYTLVNTATYRIRYKIWQGYFNLPFTDYEKMSIGDMKMRLDEDTTKISSFAEEQTIEYVTSFITLLGSMTVLFIIDWRLAFYSAITIPLTFWLDSVLSKQESILNNTNRENDQKFSSWLHASILGWREVKLLTLEYSQERQFIRYLHNFALYFCRWINYWTARILVVPKIKDDLFKQFGLYFIGGLLIIKGDLKISNLLIFILYYTMFSKSVGAISKTDSELQSDKPFLDRLLEELTRKENIDKKTGIMPGDSNKIVLDNVSFTYPNSEKEILHNISLVINKGERVAIVGKSGSGKTTLLKLIVGMITPTKGNVFFSEVNLKDIDLYSMHARFGFVMQENMLFNTSIRDNLLYGRNDAADNELYEACKKAYIYDFILGLPDGLDTVIGEKGIKLSGGQRQRIVLARLFLRNVDIFIFDEATSALDQYSENIIYDAVRNISEDKTIIIVAHRESSINLCNRKIVIE